MASDEQWTDWVSEPPFEFRFRGPWVNYDGEGGPGRAVNFCGLKCIDFAMLPGRGDEATLYLLEVKSAEWLGASVTDEHACDLFRCYFDSLGVLTRYTDENLAPFRRAAQSGAVRLILFVAPRQHPGPDGLLALMDGLRRRLKKKFRSLDVDPELHIGTLETAGKADSPLFQARR